MRERNGNITRVSGSVSITPSSSSGIESFRMSLLWLTAAVGRLESFGWGSGTGVVGRSFCFFLGDVLCEEKLIVSEIS